MKIDGKGRMSVPADFRRVLEEDDPSREPGALPRLMLLYGPHLKTNLEAYSVGAFDEIASEIRAMKRGSPKRNKLIEMVLGQAIRLDVDKDGRIVMPIRQRARFGADVSELMLSGAGDHFKIWTAEAYTAEVEVKNEAWLEEQGEDFDLLSLLGDGGD
jgi:MraZ protein